MFLEDSEGDASSSRGRSELKWPLPRRTLTERRAQVRLPLNFNFQDTHMQTHSQTHHRHCRQTTGTHIHRHTHTQAHTHTPRVQMHRLLRLKDVEEEQKNKSVMPEIEAHGGERIQASPTEACPCKTFLANFPYWNHFDFGVLPDLAHFTFSSEKPCCLV